MEVLIRYGELFIKSEPVKRIYEKKLVKNIKRSLKENGIEFKIYRKRGRIFITSEKIKEVCEMLKNIPGITSFSPCYHLQTSDLRKIKNFVKKNYEKWVKKRQTFAIRAQRVGKHKFTSKDVENEVGKVVDRKVNLKNPDVTIGIEIRDNDTYIFTEKIRGIGGLPVSASGKVLALLSGGIDSPVASFLMMKRGCKVDFIHFHSFPLVSKKSIEKVKELIKVLNKFQNKSKLYLIPFADIQSEIKTKIEARYRIIFYRRFMLKISEEVAKKENAKALVTGDSLGQVSSQTLQNIFSISEAVKIPIFRPLIGLDKEEIVSLAKKIGTYEISIKPQEDCCTLFIPKHPTTKAKIEIVKKLEKKLAMKKLIKNAIKKAEVLII